MDYEKLEKVDKAIEFIAMWVFIFTALFLVGQVLRFVLF